VARASTEMSDYRLFPCMRATADLLMMPKEVRCPFFLCHVMLVVSLFMVRFLQPFLWEDRRGGAEAWRTVAWLGDAPPTRLVGSGWPSPSPAARSQVLPGSEVWREVRLQPASL
jgi:hypothetical protein